MAPFIAFPLILLGMAVCLAAALWLVSMLPAYRCRRMTRRAVSAVLFVAAIPVTIWGSVWASKALVIILAYGHDAYASGLWIINKRGDLNNGESLGDFWAGVWGAVVFLWFLAPMLPLVVFLGVTDRPAERSAKTGEAIFYRGLVRRAHAQHSQALEDFQMAAHLFAEYLRYVEELPAEERDIERTAAMRDLLLQSEENINHLRNVA